MTISDRELCLSLTAICVFADRFYVQTASDEFFNEEADSVYEILQEKGIICCNINCFIRYENNEFQQTEVAKQGLLIYLPDFNYSYLMSMTEACEWAKSLPFGRILVDGIDYTAVAELYSALYYLEDMDYCDYALGTTPDKDNKEMSKRIEEMIKLMLTIQNDEKTRKS